MKEDLKRSFRGNIFLNCAFSAVICFAVASFLVYNLETIRLVLEDISAGNGLINPSNSAQIATILILVLGIGTFVGCFFLFQYGQTSYVKEIASAMKQISKGDLSARIEVKGDDELAYMAATMNNMTEDIQTLIERERESEKSKNELITNVAHDLRTPLTSILGYLELLCADRGQLSEDVRKQYTRIARDKAVRLQNLIEELFGFTKMSHGRMAVHLGQIDIVQLLEQLIDEFYPVFEEKEMECHYETSLSSCIIEADGDLIARLFENLINNATKYGADGKRINIDFTHTEQMVTVRVANFGSVIPANELPLIFDKFYRVEQSRATTTGGTGLGLAIAKTIVELHGGSIEVSSDLENGTVFTVRLHRGGVPQQTEHFEHETEEE